MSTARFGGTHHKGQANAAPSNVAVRHCHELREFEACRQIEQVVWETAEAELLPLPILVVAAHTGGQVLGAFDGKRLVGFTLAMAAFRQGRMALHSHMTAVLAEYRDRGVGRRLKLFQREDALARGIELVEWTFDPLELKNAHFNLERLGAIVRTYLPNAYGITTSPLHRGLPTDRFLAEWWLRSPHALSRLEGFAKQGSAREDAATKVRVSVPVGLSHAAPAGGESRKRSPGEVARIQGEIGKQFQDWFGKGYAVTGIEITAEKGDYLLEPAAGLAGVPAGAPR